MAAKIVGDHRPKVNLVTRIHVQVTLAPNKIVKKTLKRPSVVQYYAYELWFKIKRTEFLDFY